MQTVLEKRRAIIQDLFPGGIPRLWSPLLTHYRDDGDIDLDRMTAHFRHIAPWIQGLLVPGTTGDGWELNDDESVQVTRFALSMAREFKTRVLMGALRTETKAVQEIISRMRTLIEDSHPGISWTTRELGGIGACGFAVCPPRGKNLSQEDIEAGLSAVLESGLPVALYQLPFVTGNEAAPSTFERLVKRYPNLIFFKDSSGRDLIAASDVDKDDVFLVRGGEGDYVRWLKMAGGPYDGFLLSVTNSFSPDLASLIDALEAGDRQKAKDLSERITQALFETITLVRSLPCGNAFTNANKAIDHFFAYGPKAIGKEGPLLKGGIRIPEEIIAATGAVLEACRLLPPKGYWE